MKIPLEPGDKVVAASTLYTPNGTPVILVVTEQGHIYEIAYDGSRCDYVVNTL